MCVPSHLIVCLPYSHYQLSCIFMKATPQPTKKTKQNKTKAPNNKKGRKEKEKEIFLLYIWFVAICKWFVILWPISLTKLWMGQAFADAYSVLENELSQFSDDCGPCTTTAFELLQKIIPSIDREEWSLITGYITWFEVLVFWLHFSDGAHCLIDSFKI